MAYTRAHLALMLVLSSVLAPSRPVPAQARAIDLFRESMSFCCKSVDGYHDLSLFKDTANNLIGNACIPGASLDELRNLGVGDLMVRLERLQAGNVLVFRNGRYMLAFPVITGRGREALNAAIQPVAQALAPRVHAMRDEILKAVPGREEMVFHLLWSRVVDQMWCRSWQREGRPGDCPPGVDWVIYPASPFTFGTNSWADEVAVTWNQQTRCALTPVVFDERAGLLDAARGKPYEGPGADALQRFGLLAPGGRFLGFAYQPDGALDSLLERLTAEYASLVAGRYDYGRLAASLGIPADQLWVIILHETAYAVFANLDRGGTLHLPPVFKGAGDLADCSQTVSFLLRRK